MSPNEHHYSRRDLLRTGLCGLGVVGAGCFDRRRSTSGPETNNTPTQCNPEDDLTMELVFQDAFDDGTIDAEKWRTNYPWGSREHNYNGYTSSQNVYVYDGRLIIEAKEEERSGKSYTTGVAAPRRTFTSGYVEGYFKTPPATSGFWPAFWLTSASTWPPEIDIFEFFGSDPQAWMSYHYEDSHGDHQRVTSPFSDLDFSNGVHRFGVDWNADRIIWYIDGEEQFRYSGDFVNQLEGEEMWLIINFGIDPDFLNSPSSEDLPASLEVSSVRVWERREDRGEEATSTETANATNARSASNATDETNEMNETNATNSSRGVERNK